MLIRHSNILGGMLNAADEVATAKILTQADLAGYLTDDHACWVRDVEHWRVVWANAAAQVLWRADSPDELYHRDVSPLSRASETRLLEYRKQIAHGGAITSQWTLFPKGHPVTVLADIRAFRMEDGRIALFFRAHRIDDAVCAESLRMLDAGRHSAAFFSLYSLDGQSLERNASFLREFGARSDTAGDQFELMFFDKSEAGRVRAEITEKGEYRGRVRMLSIHGLCWHMLLALTMFDPVDGKRVIHVETIDITDQVEAEARARSAEQLLQRIADEFAHPVAYIAADKSFRFVNKLYCHWVGRTRESVLRHSLREVAGDESDKAWDFHWPKVAQGERISYERQVEYADQRERWVSIDAIPFRVDEDRVQGALVFFYDVHALRMAQSSLRSRELEMLRINDSLPVAVCKFDLNDRIVFANNRFCSWVNRHSETVLGCDVSDVVGREVSAAMEAPKKRAFAGETVTLRRTLTFDGRECWLDFTLAPAIDDAGNTIGIIAICNDVTKRVFAERELSEAKNTLASHLDNTPLAVIELDSSRRVKAWTGCAEAILLWPREDAFGRRLEELRIFDEEGRTRFEDELNWLDQSLSDRFTMQFRNIRRDGTPIHAEWYGSVLRDTSKAAHGGKVTSYLMLLQDTSARVTAEHHLQYVANHDLLTGLANRSHFQERLETDVARAHRHQRSLAVVLIDLDRFKYVNDSLGHQIGDTLLQQVAARLTKVVGEGDLIARAGGDEFMVLIDLAGAPARAQDAVESIRQQLAAPFQIASQEVFVTASLGVTLYPNDATTGVDLIKNADWAMFRAKDAGRNSVQFFASTMINDSSVRLSTETELRRALENRQLELHYQAKIDIATGHMTGAEALLRWRHPLRGLVPPESFIPFAEETGLIVDIGAWVISESCRQIAAWRNAHGRVMQIAINLSAVQLKRPGLPDGILAELRRHDLPGSALMVEITETSVVTDPILASESLQALRSQGVHAAIDDFGKGFSSLIQLKRLPIDALKIDGSFIRDLGVDRDDAAIVNAIIGLAHNLDLKVIAECVETQDQLAFLKKSGCDEAQGYFFSRPIPADEFAAKFLRAELGSL